MSKKQKKVSNNPLNVTLHLNYDIRNWSDSLSYDDLLNTIFVVGNYLVAKENGLSITSAEDTEKLEQWLEVNNFDKFIRARHIAEEMQMQIDETEEFAKEIISTPISKRSLWH